MSDKKEKYTPIGSKVADSCAAIFERICRKKGINKYQAIQMMIDSFVRYTDDRHNLSAEMEQLMSVFEHMEGWKEAFNLADPNSTRKIDEAIYLLTAEGKKGARAILVHRPFFGDWSETVNVQTIFDRIIQVLFPERYARLLSLCIDMDCSSMLELLDRMIDANTVEQLNASLRQDFEDCNRSEYGRPIEYGQRTKRKHHKGVEMYDEQPIRFIGEDIQQADDEVKRSDDEPEFRPFGVEW